MTPSLFAGNMNWIKISSHKEVQVNRVTPKKNLFFSQQMKGCDCTTRVKGQNNYDCSYSKWCLQTQSGWSGVGIRGPASLNTCGIGVVTERAKLRSPSATLRKAAGTLKFGRDDELRPSGCLLLQRLLNCRCSRIRLSLPLLSQWHPTWRYYDNQSARTRQCKQIFWVSEGDGIHCKEMKR